MSFNSHVFILLFLPVVLIGYYSLNHFKQGLIGKLFLLASSAVFYCYVNPVLILVLALSAAVNWLLAKAVRKKSRAAYISGLIFNIGLLGFLKYYNFFVTSLNLIFHGDLPYLNLLQPLGISFFTFENIIYLSDCWKEEVEDYSLLDYALFISCFLYVSSGPICSHKDIIPQFNDVSKKKFSSENFARGIWMFVIGLAKKALIADVLGKMVDAGYGDIGSMTSLDTWIVIFSYGIQLYFDFSGYCDMASGVGRMLNIELPMNFDSPYKSRNVQEFWHRWHMSLNMFFTKYVYFPLGGSRKGKARKYLNIMIVFLLSGLWHGANYTFLVWGFLHGICMIVCDKWKKGIARLPGWSAVMIQFLITDGLFAIFRANSITQASQLFHQAFSGIPGISISLLSNVIGPEPQFLAWTLPLKISYDACVPYLVLIFFVVVLCIVFIPQNAQRTVDSVSFKPWQAFGYGLLLFWSVMSITGINVFIYNKF